MQTFSTSASVIFKALKRPTVHLFRANSIDLDKPILMDALVSCGLGKTVIPKPNLEGQGMRQGGKTFDDKDLLVETREKTEDLSYDEGKFFDSFYEVGANGEPDDRSTIGPMVTKTASRFHYNAVENAIIQAISHLDGLPYGGAVRAWEMLRNRQELRHLDIGSGSGHWIDFFIDALYVKSSVGVEVAPSAAEYLMKKYDEHPEIEIVEADIGSSSISYIDGRFDYVTAIGVLFHIVDDQKWLQALRNLKTLTAEEGLIIIGGDFGAETKNVQFHCSDRFDDWADMMQGANVLVNKRVRSLADWHKAAAKIGLVIVDLVRAQSDWAIHTPDNDILVLPHA